MTRKLAFGVMAGWLAAFSSLGQEPAKTSVAIYPLKAAGAVDKAVAQALSALLSSELTPSPRLRVIEEAMLKEVMERQAMNISDMCDDTVCQVEIGKLVQAQKIVTGDLVKLGNKYILSLRLIDIQSGTTEFSTKDECACSEDQLDQLVAVAAARIRNYFGEKLPLPQLAPGTAPPASAALSAPTSVAAAGKSRIYVGNRSPNLAFKVSLNRAFEDRIEANQCLVFEVEPGDQDFGFTRLFTEAGKNYYLEVSQPQQQKVAGGLAQKQTITRTRGELVPEAQGIQWAQNCQPAQAGPSKPAKKK